MSSIDELKGYILYMKTKKLSRGVKVNIKM